MKVGSFESAFHDESILSTMSKNKKVDGFILRPFLTHSILKEIFFNGVVSFGRFLYRSKANLIRNKSCKCQMTGKNICEVE